MGIFSGNTIALLVVGTIAGIIGLGAFRHGKNNGTLRPIVYGVALMIYPYFVWNLWPCIGVGMLLVMGLTWGDRLGL